MKTKKKSQRVIQTIFSVFMILLCFVIIFLAKAANALEAKGYFTWNPDTQTYEVATIKELPSIHELSENIAVYSKMKNTFFRIDKTYYIISSETVEENIVYNIEPAEAQEVSSKPDKGEPNKLIILSVKFFSKENMLNTVTNLGVWLLTLTMGAGLAIVQAMVYSLRRDKNIDSEECQKVIETYNNRVKMKPLNFAEFIYEDNRNEKIRVYKEKQNEKLAKIKKELLTIDSTKTKKIELLMNKKKKIENQLSPEYINENIDSLYVKYNKLHESNYAANTFEKNVNARKDYSSEGSKLTVMSIKKIIMSVIMTMILAGLTLQLYFTFSLNAGFIIIILTTVLSFGMTTFRAVRLADSIYNTDILGVLRNKTAILEKATVWAQKHPTSEQSFEDVIGFYLDQKLEEINKK